MTMLLENTKIRLRALEPEDLDSLYKWENDTRLWIHGNSLSPYSRLTLRQYIQDAQTQDIYQAKQLRLMIESKADKEIVGTVDLYDFDVRNQRMGVGILIDEKVRNKKYASETLSLIEQYTFSYLKVHQLYAYISVENATSIKLFEKCGFVKNNILKDWIYVDEKWVDVIIYQLISDKK